MLGRTRAVDETVGKKERRRENVLSIHQTPAHCPSLAPATLATLLLAGEEDGDDILVVLFDDDAQRGLPVSLDLDVRAGVDEHAHNACVPTHCCQEKGAASQVILRHLSLQFGLTFFSYLL